MKHVPRRETSVSTKTCNMQVSTWVICIWLNAEVPLSSDSTRVNPAWFSIKSRYLDKANRRSGKFHGCEEFVMRFRTNLTFIRVRGGDLARFDRGNSTGSDSLALAGNTRDVNFPHVFCSCFAKPLPSFLLSSFLSRFFYHSWYVGDSRSTSSLGASRSHRSRTRVPQDHFSLRIHFSLNMFIYHLSR